MDHFTIRGRIKYTSRKPEIHGKERGGENFALTFHPDGRKTLRAHCAIHESPPRVLRESIITLGSDWRPRGGFVQISVDGDFVGSAWYRMTDEFAECEGWTAREGRISHKIELDRPAAYFGTHPMQADAWHCSQVDISKGPTEQQIAPRLMCSAHHRGADGPSLIYTPNGNTFAFIGREQVTVPAGTFEALHFRIGAAIADDYQGSDVHPTYHIWTTADGTYVFLRAHVTGYMQTYYELMEYSHCEGFGGETRLEP